MKTYRLGAVVLLTPVLAFLLSTLGCSSSSPSPTAGGGSDTSVEEKKASKDLKALASTGWGTLKGKVAFVGAPPKVADIKDREDFKNHQDKDKCLMGDTTEQTWKVKDGGLGNVFVWLKPPEGTYFKIELDEKTWDPTVTLTQPYCAFIPHAFVLFPSYYDPTTKAQKSTGQKFFVTNSASFAHNTKWAGSKLRNEGGSRTIAPKGELEVTLKPDNQEITFNCDIHKWMDAYARVFDHPYATVTKEDGTYEIKHVPTGADLQIVAWHEKAGYLDGGSKGVIKKLNDGENTQNFTAKK
jgi:hypothetical protein